MKRTLSKIVSIILFMSVFVSCGTRTASISVTSYPVQYLFERIAGDTVLVNNISQGTFYQRLSLVPNATRLLKQSDALFYIREFEPYIDELAEEISDDVDLINLANANSVYNFNRYTKELDEEGIQFIETPYYEGEVFKGINLYLKDPMLWMDPITMSAMGSTVMNYLVQKYPKNANMYRENFAELELELAQLDSRYQTFLINQKEIRFAVMAPNYGNWQKSYGIEVYPVIVSKDGEIPTEEQLELIKLRMIQDGVVYMAVEEGLPEDVEMLQEELINELGLVPIHLNSFADINELGTNSTLDYMGIMYQNYSTLETIAN